LVETVPSRSKTTFRGEMESARGKEKKVYWCFLIEAPRGSTLENVKHSREAGNDYVHGQSRANKIDQKKKNFSERGRLLQGGGTKAPLCMK